MPHFARNYATIQGVATAILTVLTLVTSSCDSLPLHILQKVSVTSVHYNSVKRSTAVFGFSKCTVFCESQ